MGNDITKIGVRQGTSDIRWINVCVCVCVRGLSSVITNYQSFLTFDLIAQFRRVSSYKKCKFPQRDMFTLKCLLSEKTAVLCF